MSTVADAPTPTTPAVGKTPTDPRWVRPTFWVLLAATAVTYLWNLGASGYANSFYAAAVQAGTQSWKAWLFGSLDSGNFITVDKPPASLWVMALSGRIFGFSSWLMLVPQALMGVASVALVYLTCRRWSGSRTALAAAALLAFMPVAALMFKFNNPDAMLVLCMLAAAYVTVRAVDAAGTRAGTWWLVAAGALVGLGFLTKQLQVMLVVPGLALVYAVVAPTALHRRIGDLVAAGVAVVVSAGWYVALVELWPASDRPYIGGSTDNSLLELALGYNGLGRITGQEGNRSGGMMPGGTGGMPDGGPPGGMGGGGPFGSSGPQRLFTEQFAGNASWLLPAGIVVLVAGLWFTRRAPRTDRTRGLLLLGGAWMVVHAVVFSVMSGIIHDYYTVALAPGVAITVAAGASILWRARAQLAARIVLAVVVVGTAGWSLVVLSWADWAIWVGWVAVAAAVVAAVLVLVPGLLARRAGAATLLVTALIGTVGASTAYAGATAVTPHSGPIVSAGPASSSSGPGRTGRDGGGPPGTDRRPGGNGMFGEQQTSPELTALLRDAGTRWSAATTGAQSAASLELASGTAVMGMGGFLGTDPAPTLQQFQEYVASGQVRYFVEGGGPGGGMRPGGDRTGGLPDGMGARGASGEIAQWVTTHFEKIDVGGRTVYDLTRPTT